MHSLSESNKEWGLSVTQIDLRDMTVGEPRTVTVQVTNNTSKPLEYRVVPLQDNKLEISASPDSGTVEPHSQMSFTLEAVIFCRTTVEVDVIVIVNRLFPRFKARLGSFYTSERVVENSEQKNTAQENPVDSRVRAWKPSGLRFD